MPGVPVSPPMSPRTRSLSPPCPLPAGAEVEKPPGGEKGDEKPPEEEPKERPGDPDPKRGTWGRGLIGWGPAGGVAKLIRGAGLTKKPRLQRSVAICAAFTLKPTDGREPLPARRGGARVVWGCWGGARRGAEPLPLPSQRR